MDNLPAFIRALFLGFGFYPALTFARVLAGAGVAFTRTAALAFARIDARARNFTASLLIRPSAQCAACNQRCHSTRDYKTFSKSVH